MMDAGAQYSVLNQAHCPLTDKTSIVEEAAGMNVC